MIFVFGSVNLDLGFPLERLPGVGETVLGTEVVLGPGGKGANQAVAAARDGARVALAGAVGRDPLAEAATALLVKAGVDLSRLARVERATGCAAVCTDRDGRNQIAVGAGANLMARAAQVEDAALHAGVTLLLQMEVAAGEVAELIRRGRALGARVVLNLAPAGEIEREALGMVDLLVVNEGEGAWLRPGADAAGLSAALGVGVVRTLGEAGAEWAMGGEAGRVEALRVRAVDTTAAGDCFTGVLAASLDRGATLGAAVQRAGGAAALCCTRRGAQASLPFAHETSAFLRGQ